MVEFVTSLPAHALAHNVMELSADMLLTRFKIQDSNTFIHQNYMISTWIDTLALVLNNFRILSMSPSYNR